MTETAHPGHIVVVGSLHYDVMVEAARQPLAGETLMGQAWYPKFGGKGGNQAVAARRLGARVEMVGAVARDAFGGFLCDVLSREAVGHGHVAELEGATGMSVALQDNAGDYAAVVVSGVNQSIAPEALAHPALWQGASILILQNEVPEPVNIAAARAARAAGARIVWNAAPMRADGAGLGALCDLLVLNAVEAGQVTGLTVADLAQAARAAEALAATGTAAIVTAGAAGHAVCVPGEAARPIAAQPVAHPKSHGAGDVFTGALAVGFLLGADLHDAAARAAEAAARHVAGQPLRPMIR